MSERGGRRSCRDRPDARGRCGRARPRRPRWPTRPRPSSSPGCGPTGPGPAVFVRIETNHGVVGWGEIKGVDPRVARGAGRVAVRAARRREPDAHRVPLAEDLPGPSRHPRRAVHGPHARRHRHGPVGHHRQAVGRARSIACWAARAATASASTTRPRPSRCRRTASTSTPATPADIDRMVNAIKAARRTGRPRRRRHVRRPLRRAAGHADPAGRGHQALRRAVHRGAGRARQHRGLQAPQGSRSAFPWRPASATGPSGR